MTRPALFQTHGAGHFHDQIRLDDAQRAHFLADALVAVPGRLVPHAAAHGVPPRRAGALARGADGAGFEFRHAEGGGEGRELDGCGHPAREVGFEGGLVVVARVLRLARDFLHDVAAELRGEEDLCRVEDVLDAGSPGAVAVGVIVHVRRAHQHRAGVVRPLDLGRDGAVVGHLRAVENAKLRVHEHALRHPVPCLLCPLGVRGVVGVARQPGGQLEEAAVGNAVFVVVAVVRKVDLPAQTAATVGCFPTSGLFVEDGLGKGEPGRLIGRWVGEFEFGGGHGGEGPEGLVVVALVDNQKHISLLSCACLVLLWGKRDVTSVFV